MRTFKRYQRAACCGAACPPPRLCSRRLQAEIALATALQDVLSAHLGAFDTSLEQDREVLAQRAQHCEHDRMQRAIAARFEYKQVLLGCCEVLSKYVTFLRKKL